MKKSTKLLAAASIAAGSALGILFAPGKGSETRKKLNKKLRKLSGSVDSECGKEKLVMIKGKLEKHKQRVEKHLQKINSRIAEYESQVSGEES
jgi:gas vesicle protein